MNDTWMQIYEHVANRWQKGLLKHDVSQSAVINERTWMCHSKTLETSVGKQCSCHQFRASKNSFITSCDLMAFLASREREVVW